MSNVFTREHIKMNLDFKDKNDYLRYIAKLSMTLGIGKEEQGVYQGLVDREKEFITNLGDGIALPHTKSSYITKPAILVLKPINKVLWGDDEEGIKIIICILSPNEQNGNTHMKLISSLAEKLIDEDFKSVLVNTIDEEEIFTMVENALNS
ncbi:PTS sugar transporter subunit IIA [Clostridium sp.]